MLNFADPWRSRSTIVGRETDGFVATSQPAATNAGLEVLRNGGNAADAAIATVAVLNVIEPCACGLGGDAFALYWDQKSRKVHSMNASGRSSSGLTKDIISRDLSGLYTESVPSDSPHAVTVPGAVAGYCAFLDKFGSGKFNLEQLLKPAINYAENGFPVHEWAAASWKKYESHLKHGTNGTELLIMDEDGKYRAPGHGELMKNPNIAKVLKEIAKYGKEGFYKGWVAKRIVEVIQQKGGVITQEDLEFQMSVGGVEAGTTFEDSISTVYYPNDNKDNRPDSILVHECAPNGQGIVALIALNILKEYYNSVSTKTKELNIHKLESSDAVDRLHVMIECLRLAFDAADGEVYERSASDPDLIRVLSEDFARERAKLIKPDKVLLPSDPDLEKIKGQQGNSVFKGGIPKNSSCTTFFTVMDPEGNAVSFIQSNYDGFGTNIIPEGCGFTLQNRGANFELDLSHNNCVGPRKRPYHTIIPGLITKWKDGKEELYCVFGNMGGFMQPQGHVQLISNLVDLKMHPQQALDFPRFCIQPRGDLPPVISETGKKRKKIDQSKSKPEILVEKWFSDDIISNLSRRGHNIKRVNNHSDINSVDADPVKVFSQHQVFGRAQMIGPSSSFIVDQSGINTRMAASEGRCDGCAMFTPVLDS